MTKLAELLKRAQSLTLAISHDEALTTENKRMALELNEELNELISWFDQGGDTLVCSAYLAIASMMNACMSTPCFECVMRSVTNSMLVLRLAFITFSLLNFLCDLHSHDWAPCRAYCVSVMQSFL